MFIQKGLRIIKQEPKKLFLVDGYGAVLSAFLYMAILANFESVFGMPQEELHFLGFLAGVYAVYSFSCYLMKVNNWQFFMKIISIANISHCFITVGLVIYYSQIITAWGILYFVGEIFIVLPLALLEWNTASNLK